MKPAIEDGSQGLAIQPIAPVIVDWLGLGRGTPRWRLGSSWRGTDASHAGFEWNLSQRVGAFRVLVSAKRAHESGHKLTAAFELGEILVKRSLLVGESRRRTVLLFCLLPGFADEWRSSSNASPES